MRGGSAFVPDARLFIDTLRFAAPTDRETIASRWQRANAAALVKLAESEGAPLALHRRLRALDITLEAEARQQLTALARRAVAQQVRLDAELTNTLAILDAANVPVVALKSAALRRLRHRIPYADARGATDIDLLVPPGAGGPARDAMRTSGYTAPKPGPADGHHLPVLVGRTGVGVELHLTTHSTISAHAAWQRATRDADTVIFDGRALHIPSDTELLWHTLTHAIGHAQESAASGVRIRYWLDAAALLASSDAIDWDRIGARIGSLECPRTDLAHAWLCTAAELSGRSLTKEMLRGSLARPLDLERLLGWRLCVAELSPGERWETKLLEEGARGEAMLPYNRGYPDKGIAIRARHYIASRAARLWWRIRR